MYAAKQLHYEHLESGPSTRVEMHSRCPSVSLKPRFDVRADHGCMADQAAGKDRQVVD